jgi:hypothetical protein
MRLTVGLTKKAGLPGFGSVGATCQLESGEFSLEGGSETFARRVERAFALCRDAVETELRRHAGAAPTGASAASLEGRPPPNNSNGHANGTGDRTTDFQSRPATPKQVNALRALAAKSRLSREELGRVFGGKPLGALTVAEASAAIDRLKGGVAPLAGRGLVNGNRREEHDRTEQAQRRAPQ